MALKAIKVIVFTLLEWEKKSKTKARGRKISNMMVKHVKLRSSSGQQREQTLLQHNEHSANLLMGKICGVAQRCQIRDILAPDSAGLVGSCWEPG